MRKPSIKALNAAFPGKGKQVRKLLDSDKAVLSNPAVERHLDRCYHQPSNACLRLIAINDVLDMHGVEYVSHGRNARSPAFWYLNAGDSYATTIVRINGG